MKQSIQKDGISFEWISNNEIHILRKCKERSNQTTLLYCEKEAYALLEEDFLVKELLNKG